MIIPYEVQPWAERVAAVFGPATEAILHYGSRAQGRAARADSAYDFFVIVSGYREAYAAARAALGKRCHPRWAVLIARVLPPNSMAIRRPDVPDGPEAKCLIISRTHFIRECSTRARDHFIQARLGQQVLLAWARNPAGANAALAATRAVREHALAWAPAFLPPRFDLDDFCRAIIAVPYAHELRAEAGGHAAVLFEAQRGVLREAYGPLLAAAVRDGRLLQDGEGYRLAVPTGWWRRFRVRSHFRRSKRRTTLRLLKHPFLYEDWLDYLLRKIERHTGQRIELTALERRYPLVCLWPRTVRFLLTRPQRRGVA